MAWLERRGERFRVVFRFRHQKLHVNLKANEQKEADGCLARLEENLRLVERGRLDVSAGADLGLFLLSDGRLEKPIEITRTVRLDDLFATYPVTVHRRGEGSHHPQDGRHPHEAPRSPHRQQDAGGRHHVCHHLAVR
jgi:hypothetical protein